MIHAGLIHRRGESRAPLVRRPCGYAAGAVVLRVAFPVLVFPVEPFLAVLTALVFAVLVLGMVVSFLCVSAVSSAV